jgi:hypothetical protein
MTTVDYQRQAEQWQSHSEGHRLPCGELQPAVGARARVVRDLLSAFTGFHLFGPLKCSVGAMRDQSAGDGEGPFRRALGVSHPGGSVDQGLRGALYDGPAQTHDPLRLVETACLGVDRHRSTTDLTIHFQASSSYSTARQVLFDMVR